MKKSEKTYSVYECEHQICKSCLGNIKSHVLNCPKCRGRVDNNKLNYVIPESRSAVELCMKCRKIKGICSCDIARSTLPVTTKPSQISTDSKGVKSEVQIQKQTIEKED
jgi:hypothetical protein